MAERRANDFYQTPQKVIDALLNNYEIDEEKQCYILEPCAGDGAIIKELQREGYCNIKAIEIRPEETQNLNELVGYGRFAIADFLTMSEKHTGRPDVIITNPPFSLAMEILEKSMKIVSEKGKVILLLRLGFLASDKRFDFMRENPPTDMFVLHKRPSFTGKGTDSQEYGWFVWDKDKQTQSIKII